MGKLSLVMGILLLTGCGASKESEDNAGSSGRLREYEAAFRPSEYDQPPADFFPETHDPTRKDTSNPTTDLPAQPQELIQGYRVQVFATTGYDDVTRLKGAVEAQFPDQWFYLVYDAPTYKLRAGNFLERYEADRFARVLAEKGYRDAWVVPEKVNKNPPLRSAPKQELHK